MTRSIFALSIVLLISNSIFAQTPQFAVVRPDGTTYICPTFDSALIKAVDDDFIYLPGIQIAGTKSITKRLTIFGTGHYPDSTLATGKSQFVNDILLANKCNFEGFEVSSIHVINANASQSSFIRIKASALNFAGSDNHLINGCAIYSVTGRDASGNCGESSGCLINSSIINNVQAMSNSNFNNCVFMGNISIYTYMATTNSNFNNCIFKGLYNFSWYTTTSCFPLVGNTSNHCIWQTSINVPGINNLINNSPDTIMINATNTQFQYAFNYHLKPNSPYLSAGNDGQQIGLYGGASPYKEGAVPSNPHIYYKAVSNASTSDGKLQIQFKVRTN
jgi:hypothetical protein